MGIHPEGHAVEKNRKVSGEIPKTLILKLLAPFYSQHRHLATHRIYASKHLSWESP